MFFKKCSTNKSLKEFSEAEKELEKMQLQAGAWRVGVRQATNGYWRAVLDIDEREYNIALPTLFNSEKDALEHAINLTSHFIKSAKTQPN